MGEPERAAAAGRYRGLPEGPAQTAPRGQEPARRQGPRREDEGVPRLPAALCRPEARGSQRQVRSLILGENKAVFGREGHIYYPPEVSSMKYCCLGIFRKEYFRCVTE